MVMPAKPARSMVCVADPDWVAAPSAMDERMPASNSPAISTMTALTDRLAVVACVDGAHCGALLMIWL